MAAILSRNRWVKAKPTHFYCYIYMQKYIDTLKTRLYHVSEGHEAHPACPTDWVFQIYVDEFITIHVVILLANVWPYFCHWVRSYRTQQKVWGRVRSVDIMLINPLRAKFFRGNINIYLHFVSFLHIDATQVFGILPQIRQEPTYST